MKINPMKFRLIPLLFLFPFFLFSQSFHRTAFGLENGLPESEVKKMLQTDDGYLWFLGRSTLTQYDGKNFQHYSFPVMNNPTDLLEGKNGEIEFCDNDRFFIVGNGSVKVKVIDTAVVHGKPEEIDLAFYSVFDHYGNRWFFDKSLFCINSEGTFLWNKKGGFPFDSMLYVMQVRSQSRNNLGKDNLGRCWIQLKNGLAVFDGKKWNRIEIDDFPGTMRSVYFDLKGRIWIKGSDANQLFEYVNGKPSHDLDYAKFSDVSTSFSPTISEDKKGNLYFIDDKLLLVLQTDGKIKSNRLSSDYFNVQIDSSGNILLVGLHQLSLFESGIEKVIYRFSTSSSTPELLIDRENDYWFLVNEKLQQFSISVLNYTGYEDFHYKNCTKENFTNRGISPMIALLDKRGRIFYRAVVFADNGVGFKGFDLFEQREDTIEKIATADEIGFVNTVTEDKNGTLWLLTYFPKEKKVDVIRFAENPDGSWEKPERIMKNPLFKSGYFCDLHYFDSYPTIYSNGYVFRGNDIVYSIRENEKDSIFFLQSEEEGHDFLVRNDSLMKFDPQKLSLTYLCRSNSQLTAQVHCIEDGHGRVWLFGHGIRMHFENGKMANVQNASALYVENGKLVDSDINRNDSLWKFYNGKIVRDAHGDIWIASNDKGLIRISNGKNGKPVCSRISEEDGLHDLSFSAIAFDADDILWAEGATGLERIDYNSFFAGKKDAFKFYGYSDGIKNNNLIDIKKGEDGLLYCSSPEGLISIHPYDNLENKIPPLVHINSLDWFEGDSSHSDLSIPYNFNPLEIKFIGICLRNGSKVRYRYFLEGLDTKWQEQTENSVKYSSLPPGKYTFKLLACNDDGLWTKDPVTISFEILPPWYKTNWFIVSFSLFVMILVIGIFRWRTVRLKSENEKLERTVRERTAEVVSQKEIIELKNHEITDSINYAKRIQSAILPPINEFQKQFNESFVLYQPKDIVSGDFYWISRQNDFVCVAAADCTGHGVPGAMVSVVCANALNRVVNELKMLEPGKILDKARDLIIETFEKAEGEVKDGMDISICTINKKTNEVQWSGANNPLWYFSSGKFIQIVGDKQPVGKHMLAKPFTTHSLQLSAGDSLYMFTDGYADQFGGPKGKKFKYKQLSAVICENVDLPSEKQHGQLLDTMENWKGNLEQVDDILVIGIKL